MNTLIHADIFFFVTTISIVVITVLLIIGWIYVMKLVSDLKRFSDKARKEGELIIEDVGRMREEIGTRKTGISWLIAIIKLMKK